MNLSACIQNVVRKMLTRDQLRVYLHRIFACFVGIVVAIPGVQWGIYFAGGGHGTICPLYMLFGPVILGYYHVVCSDPPGPREEMWLFSGMFGLYGAYAVVLAWGRRRSLGKWVVMGVLFFHYSLVLLLSRLEAGSSSFRRFEDLLGSVPFRHSFGMVEYYFLLHVAAVAFAVSSWPLSRADVKRTVLSVALVTLVSFAYVRWVIAT